MPYYKGVTLLITHYNRSSSLERLLQAFKQLDMQFEETVVSDDGSRPEHLQVVQAMAQTYQYRLVTTPVNKGLGNNINKGQDAVTTPYTLYIQEDFIPLPPLAQKLAEALVMLEEDSSLDVARFYAYFKYPLLQPFKNGFSVMRFSLNPFSQGGYFKFYAYSDHPHLRRSSYFNKFGRYREGLKTERTEYWMMMSFLQHKGKGLFYNDFQSLLEQYNPADEPSTVKRNYWRNSGSIVVTLIRNIYRHLRFHFDYLFR